LVITLSLGLDFVEGVDNGCVALCFVLSLWVVVVVVVVVKVLLLFFVLSVLFSVLFVSLAVKHSGGGEFDLRDMIAVICVFGREFTLR
jgi:hypothetical protein